MYFPVAILEWKDRPIQQTAREVIVLELHREGQLSGAVKEIIAANPDKVEEYRAKPKLIGWFVGQVMKSTGGKANPTAVNEILKRFLDV